MNSPSIPTSKRNLPKVAILIFLVLFIILLYLEVNYRICDCHQFLDTDSLNITLALHESNGFFTDITNPDWILLKKRQKASKDCMGTCKSAPAHVWYQENFEPTFTCQHELRVGGMGDGGKWVCDPHRISKNDCLIYSVGSNNDFRFEEEVLKLISDSCEIHTFDPSVKIPRPPKSVHFHPWGISSKTETLQNQTKPNRNGWNMKSVNDVIEFLGHQNRTIDIFKTDCERCEWGTYQPWNNISNI